MKDFDTSGGNIVKKLIVFLIGICFLMVACSSDNNNNDNSSNKTLEQLMEEYETTISDRHFGEPEILYVYKNKDSLITFSRDENVYTPITIYYLIDNPYDNFEVVTENGNILLKELKVGDAVYVYSETMILTNPPGLWVEKIFLI